MASEDKPTKTKTIAGKAKAKPAPVTVQLVNKVCDEIAQGVTLTEICKREGMPNIQAVNRFVNRSGILRDRLARARATAAEVMADELAEIADDGSNDYVDRLQRDGSMFPTFRDEHVRRSQLRIQTRQWLLSKMLPDRYGDRVATQVTGPGGGPVQVEHSISPAMLANLANLRARLPAALPEPASIEHKRKA